MRFIPTSLHGLADYTMAAVLIIVPLVAGWDIRAPQALVPLILGLSILLYSLFTRYQMGAVDLVRMELHIAFDLVVGVILIASPWCFGFAQDSYVPHLVAGVVQIAVTLLSEAHPRGEWVKQL